MAMVIRCAQTGEVILPGFLQSSQRLRSASRRIFARVANWLKAVLQSQHRACSSYSVTVMPREVLVCRHPSHENRCRSDRKTSFILKRFRLARVASLIGFFAGADLGGRLIE